MILSDPLTLGDAHAAGSYWIPPFLQIGQKTIIHTLVDYPINHEFSYKKGSLATGSLFCS
jgi:hypothetical protein